MRSTMILIVIGAIFFLGCAHTGFDDIRVRNLNNLKKLQLGMTKDKVNEIMGKERELVKEEVYYQGYLVGHRDVDVSNPYKTERQEVGGKSYEMLFYYADRFGMGMGFWDRTYRKAQVADRFLTPLVFEEGRLIGWGREFAEEKNLLSETDSEGTDSMLWGR